MSEQGAREWLATNTRQESGEISEEGMTLLWFTEIDGEHVSTEALARLLESYADTLLAERDQWRCFHCEFATADREEAAAHFGDCDEAEPICRTWAVLNADGKLAEYQTQIWERNAVERENERLRVSNEGLEYRTHAEEQSIRAYKPFKDCHSINDVFCMYDSMEGEAIAAKERAEKAEAELEQARQQLAAKAPITLPIETPFRRALTVVIFPTGGEQEADADLAAVADGSSQLVRIGVPDLYVHQLRLRAERDPRVLKQVAVFYFSKGKMQEVGLRFEDELKWPVDLWTGLLEKEMEIEELRHQKRSEFRG